MVKGTTSQLKGERELIGTRLADFRERANLSQEEAAAAVGISRQMISKYECGKAKLGSVRLKQFAKLYNVSIDALIGKDNKFSFKYSGEIEMYLNKKFSYLDIDDKLKVGFRKVPIKDNQGNQLVYHLDDKIKNISTINLFAVKLTEKNDVLGVPEGSIVLLEYDERKQPIKEPTYMMLNIGREGRWKTNDGVILEGTINTCFITKVSPLVNINSLVNRPSENVQYYKFTDIDGKELYTTWRTISQFYEGKVKKVIIDY